MNTTSLIINGRTAADLALLPQKPRWFMPALPRTFSDTASPTLFSVNSAAAPSSPRLFSRSAPSSARSSFSSYSSRPSSRRSSKGSNSGWYNTENNLTLEDFARQLNTTSKRFEIWQGRCAQNVVMALMRPTPLILFVLNPLCLVVWIVLAFLWLRGKMDG